MSTPVGHGILGLSVVVGVPLPSLHNREWLVTAALALVASVAPDFDFLPGLLIGDANRFHQKASHSFVAAIVFGLLTAAAVVAFSRWSGREPRLPTARLGLAGGLAYGSHLLVDYFLFDPSEPVGQPLLWPFTDGTYISPVPVFHGIHHGAPGDPLPVILDQIFSLHNLEAILVEAAVLGPVLGIVWLLRRPSWPRGS